MNKKYKIGIDIGGTNTDAVLVDSNQNVLAATKTLTTTDIHSGFSNVLESLRKKAAFASSEVKAIFMGTTHATNAILQCRGLYKVGVIRLAGHRPEVLPPCYAWPEELKAAVYGGSETVDGGFECHGTSITAFDKSKLKLAFMRLLDQGIESVAIVGVFSPIDGAQEMEAMQCIRKIAGEDFPVSLSHQIGGIGFIERENSTILNAALRKVMSKGFTNLRSAMQDAGFDCPLFITQNNGSIISMERASEYPVLTISAGPTNSFIGGAKLSRLSDAIVVDVGGTSTDVGVVRNGFPRRSLNKTNIGGVSLNFPMPNVLSIGLGGGSYIGLSNGRSCPAIGPESAGCMILQEARSFGGSRLTMTDVALALGHISIDGAAPGKIQEPQSILDRIMEQAVNKVQSLVAAIAADHKNLPVIMVGGGSRLFTKERLDHRYMFPEHAGVANAYGAALAEISGMIDTVVSLEQRSAVLEKLQAEAQESAISNGADPSRVKIVNLEIIPYHYVPNSMARVVVTAAGPQK